MKHKFCASALCISLSAAMLAGCGKTADNGENIWLNITPVQETEFGEPRRADGTYLSQKVYPPEEDPYKDDTAVQNTGFTAEGLAYAVYREHAEIIGHTDAFQGDALVIPDTLEGVPVTRIAAAEPDEEDPLAMAPGSAFANCYHLRTVSLPETLTEIGDFAFYNCKNLHEIRIPERVTKIGTRAFALCSKLSRLNVPVAVGEIGADAFSLTPWYDNLLYECELVIFNGVLYDAGKLCRGDIVIPDYVTEIADYAFYCTPGMDSIVIPESVEKIGKFAFSTCHELRRVEIHNPDCIIPAGEDTFSNKPEGGNQNYFWGTFYAAKDSTTERFAKKMDFLFEEL